MYRKPLADFDSDLIIRLEEELKVSHVLLLLSGGSTMAAFGKAISEIVELAGKLEHQLTISLVDERWTTDSNHRDSNWWRLTQLDAFEELIDSDVRLVPVLKPGVGLLQTAEMHNQLIQNFPGKVIAVLGIGRDGHTAGILPHREDHFGFFNADRMIGYDLDDFSEIKDDFRQRITPGFKLIASWAEGLMIIEDDKGNWEVVAAIIEGRYRLCDHPAAVFSSIKAPIYTFD